MTTPVVRGVIHGRTIELNEDPAMPDGTVVELVVHPVLNAPQSVITDQAQPPLPGCGSWSSEGQELDDFLEWSRGQRKISRELPS